jgi:hypothetical protein
VVFPPIIRSAYNCIYSIWYLSHRYCYLPLSWKSWNSFERAVGGVRHPQLAHTRKDGARPALFLVVLFYVFFVLFYVLLCCYMYCLFCVVLCIVCVYMCTEQLPSGGYPIAVKYIISYNKISYIISYNKISYIISYYIISCHISYHIISYHIISYHIISYHIISYIISYIIYHIVSYHISYKLKSVH